MQQIKVKWPLNPKETVLFKVHGVYLKNSFNAKQGVLYLTNERVVFEAKPMMMVLLFGVIGWLLSRKKISVDFPLSDITDFKRGKQGFNKKVAEFDLIDGRKIRIGITGKWEVFDTAYQKAMLDVQPLFSVN
ncbi:GRAM domain-containing protein [Chitinophaga polysaccharea]|uniref:GRAM domain-containing protein n=1 Tax=Chitinophaga polysaccharea TaxID=1293035 RepID=UPI0011579D39|nr:GRAM domain-containing protein [Chitinophaga polysaccharea]